MANLPAQPGLSGSNDWSPVADLQVLVGGKPLAPAVAACLVDVSVVQTLGQASQATLRLGSWNPDLDAPSWIDDDKVSKPGLPVEVQLGYSGQLKSVFKGEIVRLDLELSSGERPVMSMIAYDVLHRLGRGQKSSPPELKKTYSDVVGHVARHYNLEADVPKGDIDPQSKAISQVNTSDLEFLNQLASEIGYELIADDKSLIFRKVALGQKPIAKLDGRVDLLQLSAGLASNNQLGSVEVRCQDPETKTDISSEKKNPQSSDNPFGTSKKVILLSGATREQCDARAEAELREMRSGYLSASGSCFGRAELAAGTVVELVNVSKRFDGKYYVTSATHTLSATGGFRTSFQLQGEPR